MRHLLWLMLLLPIQVGCGDSGNQVVGTTPDDLPPKTQAEIEAEMGGTALPD